MKVEVDWIVFGLQVVTFLLAAPLLWKLYIEKLIKNLRQRDEFIKDGIESIEKGREEIETMKTEYEKKFEELKTLAKDSMEKAAAEGERAKQEMIESAKSEGEKLIEAARREIEAEKLRAVEEVKGTMIDISMLAARKVIHANMTKKASAEAVEQAIKDLKKN